MSSTPPAAPVSWTAKTHRVANALHPVNLASSAARRVGEKAKAHAATRDAAASRAGNAGSHTGRIIDNVKLGALQGAHMMMTTGLVASATIGGLVSPLVRSSLWACAVPLGLVGSGATAWARKPEAERGVLYRMAVGLVGYGALGALVGAAAGSMGPRTNAAPEGALATAWDVTTAGLGLVLHGLQAYLCLYPEVLLGAAVAGACVVGAVLGALYGLITAPGAKASAPAAAAEAPASQGGKPSVAPDKTPTDKTPTDKTPTDKTPTDKTPTDKAPTAGAPDKPAAASPVPTPEPKPPGPAGSPAVAPDQAAVAPSGAEGAPAAPAAPAGTSASTSTGGPAAGADVPPKPKPQPQTILGGELGTRPIVQTPDVLGPTEEFAALERKRKFDGARYDAEAADGGSPSPVASAPNSVAVSASSSISDLSARAPAAEGSYLVEVAHPVRPSTER